MDGLVGYMRDLQNPGAQRSPDYLSYLPKQALGAYWWKV